MSDLKSGYTKVPDQIISSKLPFSVLKVMLHLLRWQNADSHYESHETIGFKCNLHASTVKRALKTLQELNYISIISRQHEQKTNIYKINFAQIDGECVLTHEERELRNLNMIKNKAIKKEKELYEKINRNENIEEDLEYRNAV
jgi:hypothetical protein